MPKKDGSPTVAEKRAARKASGTVRPGSVADNRAKAQEKAQTMLQYKVENNINNAKTRKKEQRQLPARQQREGSVAYNRANNTQSANAGNNNQSAGAGTPAPTAEETALKQKQAAHKYSKEDNYEGIGYKNKDANFMKENEGYVPFAFRVTDEYQDGETTKYKFNQDKFFSETKKGWENDGLSSTEKMSSEGLYKDKYYGPSHDDAWQPYVGSQHYDREAGVYDAGFASENGNFYRSANRYMSDGGYAGDVLKHLDGIEGEKDRLSTPDQIHWYNTVVKRAQDYDWTQHESSTGDPRMKGNSTGVSSSGHTSMSTYTPNTYDAEGNVLTPSSNSHDPSTYKTYDPADTLPGEPGKATPFTGYGATKKKYYMERKDQELAQKYPGYKPGHMTGEGWVSGYMPGNAKASGSSGDMTAEQMKKATGGEQIHYSGHSEPENDSSSNSSLGYQDWESQMATAQSNMNNINPYSTRPGKTKASNMNFTFDPYKY